MAGDNSVFLNQVTLDAYEWRGVRRLANAVDDFEPLAKRTGLGESLAERLVSLGIAERGPCSGAYVDYPVGYRLSALGWQVHERGRFPRRQ